MTPFQLIYPLRRGKTEDLLLRKTVDQPVYIRNKVIIKILEALNIAKMACWDVKPCAVTGTDVSA
jgi:hypothetical protein